jgi:hypothetical protein
VVGCKAQQRRSEFLIPDQKFADTFLQAVQTPTPIFFLFLALPFVLHSRLDGIGLALCRSGAAGQWGVKLSMLAVAHNISNGKSFGASGQSMKPC